MEAWLATHNRGKVIEFQTLLPKLEFHTQVEIGAYSPPPETGKSFEENARMKARSLKAVKPSVWVIGEDSGLEVDGLNKMPGIHSARYAGDHASDAENIAKLLKMMQLRSAANRAARFVCCIIAYSPEGAEYIINGKIEGRIADKPRGQGGFGYDPIFIPENEAQTFAELGLSRKNQISHRAHAIRKLAELF